MTARTETIGRRIGAVPEPISVAGRALDFLGRALGFQPYDDLVAMALVAGLLSTVGWSVQLARWGNSPFMHGTLLLAGAAGFLFARVRLHWVVGHIMAMAGGFAVVFWQAGYRAEGANILERSRDVWERFFLWVEAARTGGISTDLVPFSVMLLSVAWMVGYFASWSVFRWRTPWIAMVALGTAILINLSYRLGRYEYTMYLFIGIAMLLFAHLAYVRRMRRWRASAMTHPSDTRRLSIQDGLLVTLGVVTFAAVIPLFEPRSNLLANTVGLALQSPSRKLEDPAKRLLSGVKGRPRILLQDFGDSLPFLGSFKLTDTPVMFIESRYPVLHAGHIYDLYTARGWLTSPTVPIKLQAGEPLVPPEGLEERLLITQRIQPDFNAATAVQASGTIAANHPIVLDVLPPIEWVVSAIPGPLDPDLPADVRQFAESLRENPVERRARTISIEEEVRSRLPDSLELKSLRVEAGRFIAAHVGRPGPLPIDSVAVGFPEGVTAGSQYTISALISRATDRQLTGAIDEYPQWVTDRYLQLPENLSEDVRELADDIVEYAAATTAFEKTQAIVTYLRSLSYSQEIAGPAVGQDGIEYFLFDTVDEPCPTANRPGATCDPDKAKGYSQYFGSAATVMLRSQGVPARMVAGYASGQYITDQGRFVVRDSDRHGWSQAYFPGYGWIDIEATPGYPVYERGVPYEEQGIGDLSRRLTEEELYEEGFFPEDVSEFEALARLLAQEGLQNSGDSALDARVYWAAGGGGVIFAAVLAGLIMWHFGMGSLAPAERAYVKMTRLGWLAGMPRLPSQTTTEYGHRIDFFLPSTGGAARAIAVRYNAHVYGPRKGGQEAAEVEGLWRKVRRALIRRALGRLLPFSK
ncbi:MAG: transglutaminase domain-containing protein [Chloroflexi bacterium]|nr:transglutaminase domain-containing protein [Chloroflexota bacterium]